MIPQTISPALLGDTTVQGDPSREAVAALRGFAYQLYASALGWLGLADGEDLYLEVAEDYAIACRDALLGVQVRDTEASKLTIRSAGSIKAIDSLVDLQSRNPHRHVTIRYLTTSEMGIEKARKDRAGASGSLNYWRMAAAGAPIAPLRRILNDLPLDTKTKTFLAGCSDDQLRAQLLTRIFWDCGQPPIEQLENDLADGLAEFVRSAFNLASDVGVVLKGRMLERLLLTATSDKDRRLRRADLLKLAEQASMLLVPRANLALLTGSSVPSLEAGLLQAGTSVGRLAGELDRPQVLARIGTMLSEHYLAVIFGSTGTGKTALARAAAVQRGGAWHIADFRDFTLEQTVQRLDGVTAELLTTTSRTVILDDLGHLGDSLVLTRLERLVNSLRRRDGAIVITAAAAPPPSSLSRLSHTSVNVVLEAPYFTKEEVEELVVREGGQPQHGALIWLMASAGHPQLTQAAIATLKNEGWPASVAGSDSVADGLAAERSEARKRLLASLPSESRLLLYRASLIYGRFRRDVALAIGKTPPPLAATGEALDVLIGPWIEEVSRGEYRVSPLVAAAGQDMLDEDEKAAIHRAIASTFFATHRILPADADTILHHSIAGGDNGQVLGFSSAVLTTRHDRLSSLARSSTLLLYLPTDEPVLGNPLGDATLRLAQFLVTAAGGSKSQTVRVWDALQKEARSAPDPSTFELVVLSKSLMVPGLSNKLPDWLSHLVRLSELSEIPALTAAMTGLRESGFEGEVPNFFFLMQAAGLNRLQQLRDLFDELDKLAPEKRHLLIGTSPHEGMEAYYVTSVWLKEVAARDFDPRRAARQFDEMSRMAERWGERVTALRCAVAAVIMLDEYAKDLPTAQEALAEAEGRLGHDTVLQRARAKLWWRHQNHEEALKEFDALALNEIAEPVERAHAAREAAISAATLGKWDRAADYFKAGASAASSGHHEILGAMSAGLTADAGQALFQAGKPRDALDSYATALHLLAQVDPDETIQGAYCHRVTRHAILWLLLEVKGAHGAVDQDIVLPPGACSNPDPSAEIKHLPLGDIGLAWYMLAQVELLLGLEPLIDSQLHELSPGGLIESMEIQRTKLHVDDAIQRLDGEKLSRWLNAYVAVGKALRERSRELLAADPINMPRGTLEAEAPEQWSADDWRTLRDLLISFAISAVARKHSEALRGLRSKLDLRGAVLDHILAVQEGRSLGESYEGKWIHEAFSPLFDNSLSPTSKLRSLIQLVLFIRTSGFSGLIEKEFASTAREQWQDIVETQRFGLRSPGLSVPAIQNQLDSYRPDLGWVARLALAALAAVDVRLGEGVHEGLVETGASAVPGNGEDAPAGR